MNPSKRTEIPDNAAAALLAALILLIGGLLGWAWGGIWQLALTGLLTAIVALAVAAWLLGTKVEPK